MEAKKLGENLIGTDTRDVAAKLSDLPISNCEIHDCLSYLYNTSDYTGAQARTMIIGMRKPQKTQEMKLYLFNAIDKSRSRKDLVVVTDSPFFFRAALGEIRRSFAHECLPTLDVEKNTHPKSREVVSIQIGYPGFLLMYSGPHVCSTYRSIISDLRG